MTKVFRPMLAATYKGELLHDDYLYSPKIDGIRCIVRDGTVYSRTMKPIRNEYVQSLFGHHELNGLDGELIVGNTTDEDVYRNTSSGVMSVKGEPDVGFYAFDYVHDRWTFEERFEEAGNIIRSSGLPRVARLFHDELKGHRYLEEIEMSLLGLGYEGVMLRRKSSPYKQGRSTLREGYLVKVKRYVDAEAVVIGYERMYTNENDVGYDDRGYAVRSLAQAGMKPTELLGKLHLKMGDVDFWVSSGFFLSERERLWQERDELIGRIVKFKSFNIGAYDKPRHPVYLGFRDEEDM